MPGYKEHLMGGVAAFGITLLLSQAYPPSLVTGCEWLGASLLGSLFPDIDTKSKGQKLFYRLLVPVFAYLLWQGHVQALAVVSAFAVLPLLVNHRGLFHRAWFIIACSLAAPMYLYLIHSPYINLVFWPSVFFCAGALSHLWLDVGLKRMFRW